MNDIVNSTIKDIINSISQYYTDWKKSYSCHKKRYLVLTLISIVIAILITSEVYALGIAPSKRIISYEHYLSHGYEEYVLDSKIIHDDGKDVAVSITASGELAEYVSITNPKIYLSGDEPETGFTYTLTLPQGLAPGAHLISIQASEYDIGSDINSQSSVGGLMTVTQQLIIEVPYTGKYLEGYLSAYSVSEDNDRIISALNIIGKGTEDVNDVRVVLRVADSYNSTIQTKELGAYSIVKDQSIKIEEQTIMENAGAYTLEYTIYYDNKILSYEKGLIVGEYDITVISADVENFKLGTVAKFNINIDSAWNAPISDITGVVTIRDMKGRIIDTINTENVTIDAKNGAITAYWDTTNVRTGQYIVSIMLRAGNQLITQEYVTEVSDDQIKVKNPSITDEKSGDIYKIIMVISLVIVVLILVSVIFLKRRKS